MVTSVSGARLHGRGVVADADHHAGSVGNARAQVAEQAALTDLGQRGGAVRAGPPDRSSSRRVYLRVGSAKRTGTEDVNVTGNECAEHRSKGQSSERRIHSRASGRG